MNPDYYRQILINFAAAPIFVAAISSIREPLKRYSMVCLLGIAAFVYLGHGLGVLEFPFGVVILLLAAWGLKWYPAIGLGWLTHSLSDAIHHSMGHPMVSALPLSSFGCAIFDPLIAIWFFLGAPSLQTILAYFRRNGRVRAGKFRLSSRTAQFDVDTTGK